VGEIHTLNTNKTIILASIYLPPDSDKPSFIDCLCKILNESQNHNKDFILVGDFNINWNIPSNAKHHIEHSLQALGLSQQVNGVSFTSHQGRESLLDHNYVSNTLNISKCHILTCDREISDHYATYLEINNVATLKEKRKLIRARSFRNFNSTAFYNEVRMIPFLQIVTDKNHSLHIRMKTFEDLIHNALNKYAPLKTIRVRGPKNQWLNPDLRHHHTKKSVL